eukprot:INCI3450.1.p1 GENE.INCI3450.1~~INCI3450.1.p1  ORF type:complete len:124 (-),score=22.34 INCI3450.1:96-467(-)
MAKSIPDLFSELQQSLKCTVCNQIFDNPHSLGCNHSFCKKCIDGFVAGGQSPVCPVCHLPFWLKDVVRNATLNSICSARGELAQSLESDGLVNTGVTTTASASKQAAEGSNHPQSSVDSETGT